jgi:nucleolin
LVYKRGLFFWFGRELFLPIFEDSGRLRGLANITYSSPAEAAAALEANGQDFNGRWLSVEKAVPREARARPQPGDSGSKPASTSCFLGNLSFQITEDMLREAFAGPWFPDRCFVYARVHPQAGVLIRVGIADCGSIVHVRIATDRETGEPRGFGHIDFENVEAATAAVAMSGTDVGGRAIRVDFAAPKGEGGGGRGGFGGTLECMVFL